MFYGILNSTSISENVALVYGFNFNVRGTCACIETCNWTESADNMDQYD